MSIFENYCRETLDMSGRLTDIQISYPDNFNFGYDVVDAITEKTPDKRALVWCNTESEERFLSFEDIRQKSNQTANVLLDAGIKRGDKVIVALKRHYEYWFVTIALHKIGAIMIPVTHMLTADDFAYRIRSAGVSGIICTPQNDVPLHVTQALMQEKANCRLWSVQKDIEGFENLTRAIESASTELKRRPTLAHDPMVLYFTSGTTGYPKGVIHDFTYPLAHIVTARHWQQAEDSGLHFTVSETGWAKASWGKIYGQWLVGSAVMVFDFDNFDPKQLTTVINRYGVTSFCAPPTIYRYLVQKGLPDMPSLRHASTAGEFLSPDIFRKFTDQTGLPLAEGYGQTETTLLTANFRGCESKDSSMGVPSPLYNIELRQENGSPVPVGGIGEVVIVPSDSRPPLGLFTQYLDNENLYSHVWQDGVYHTGDAAWKDDDGYYWFHGRFDDIIKSSGFRIGPYEVENVIAKHPAVLECSVIGIPDTLRGQSVKAIIVLVPGHEPSHQLDRDIRDFCNSKLAEYKWVRSIEFVSAMPKTISGKIRKTELRKA
ncbi:MAG: AMP-binding protein [Clostridiaceae bacterium]|nr:AMP-binding protein [Clostridiaceae bacterium]